MSGTKGDSGGINVKVFEDVDHSAESRSYIDILDKFDALPGIQVLKQGAIERCRFREGMSVLDSGCGAGLETVRLARLVAPSGKVTGLDTSQAFLAEASRRARGLRLPIEYRQGDAQQLPFADRSFDVARAERLFLYLKEPATALAELAQIGVGDDHGAPVVEDELGAERPVADVVEEHDHRVAVRLAGGALHPLHSATRSAYSACRSR